MARLEVRRFHAYDREPVWWLTQLMHKESWFGSYHLSREKVDRMFDACVEGFGWLGLAATDIANIPRGMFVGAISEQFFGKDRYAFDVALYLEPAYRGSGFAAARMVREFEKWAGGNGVCEIH